MKVQLTRILFTISVFGSSSAVFANLADQVQPIIDKFSKSSRSMGVILVERGQETFVHSAGFRDLKTADPNSCESILLIASISKQITATAVLRLVDQGLLSLDAKISDIFPEFDGGDWRKGGVAVTVHHLLSHTAGTPDAYSERSIKRKLFKTPISMQDILEAIRGKKIKFVPGSNWEYSNTGYLLLGEIVRRISGVTYSEFMKREFFGSFPGMSVGPLDSPFRAQPYTDNWQGERVNFIEYYEIKEFHDGDVFTDGNIYSTVTDLKNWIKLLTGGKLLSPGLTQKMFTPVRESYGYGWIIKKLADGSDLVFHNGSFGGYTGDALRILQKDLTIVWLRNQEGDSEENNKLIGELLTALVAPNP